MKTFMLTLLLLMPLGAYSQAPSGIKQRCQNPYSSIYANVLVAASGNIQYNPCPTKSNIFTGIFDLSGVSQYLLQRTITPNGTVGNRTINKPAGSVNFDAGDSTLIVTNSTVTANSLIFVTPQVNDNGCTSFGVDSRATGSFTIVGNASCIGETAVAFWVTN